MSDKQTERAEAIRNSISGLPRRQQILGAYIAELYDGGVIPREAPVSQLTRIALRQLGSDIKSLATFVVEQQVRGGLAEMKRAFDHAVDALFKRGV